MAWPRGALLLVAGALAAVWYLFEHSRDRASSFEAPAVGTTVAAAAASGWFAEDAGGCLVPRRIGGAGETVERGPMSTWRVGGSGDVLRVDPCGHVWALWFNSWVIHLGGDPDLRGEVSLPRQHPALTALVHAGVRDFLPRRGELWLLGRSRVLVRYRHGVWERIDTPLACEPVQLLEFDGGVLLVCRLAGSGAVYARHEQDGRGSWLPVGGGMPGLGLLAVSTTGRLIASAPGALLLLTGAGDEAWQRVPRPGGDAVALAADAQRVVIADESGIEVVDYSGRPIAARTELKGVRGVAIDRSGIWAAAWRDGLHFFDGSSWRRWDYASGLPDDSGRDLLLTADRQLWMAGTPSAAIDAAAAAEAVGHLSIPTAIDARVYPDACAAADSELLQRAVSGQVSREAGIERRMVFFRSRQVCPDPILAHATDPLFVRRPADGALLRIPYNAHRGVQRCGVLCAGEARESHLARWTMSWFVPRSTGARSGFDRIDLDAPQPLPLEAPGMAIELPDDGSVWVGTREDGVLRYRNGAWERHAESTGLGGAGKLIDMAGDHLGRMWVLSQPAASNPLPERGSIAPLHVWEGDRWRPLTPSWASSAVQARALVPGRTGMLLVSNGPLYAIEEDGSAPRLIGQDIGEPAAVAVDEAGMLWIAESLWSSRRGLRIIDGGRVGHLDSRDGLVDDRIRSLAWDGRGQVWMLSERGRVAVYDRQLLFRHARWSPGHTAAEAVER